MRKIIFTGPESSGKSSLAAATAIRLGVPCVPEFARCYLAHLGRPYTLSDLPLIAHGQLAWEAFSAAQSLAKQASMPHNMPPTLLCDTDWTVLHIWESYRFRKKEMPPHELIWQNLWQNQAPAQTHHFLCAPDFPWQADALREHPHERDTLFIWYENLLRAANLPYTILYGAHEARIAAILEVIKPD